jgi:hypothetical protein
MGFEVRGLKIRQIKADMIPVEVSAPVTEIEEELWHVRPNAVPLQNKTVQRLRTILD